MTVIIANQRNRISEDNESVENRYTKKTKAGTQTGLFVRPHAYRKTPHQKPYHTRARSSEWHRSHTEIIRAALMTLADYGEVGIVTTRLTYSVHSTSKQMPKLLEEMEDLGLIKYRLTNRFETMNAGFKICITAKGLKLLALLNAQSQMIEKAPWTLENTA
jgi:predicted transcriptional regulator